MRPGGQQLEDGTHFALWRLLPAYRKLLGLADREVWDRERNRPSCLVLVLDTGLGSLWLMLG